MIQNINNNKNDSHKQYCMVSWWNARARAILSIVVITTVGCVYKKLNKPEEIKALLHISYDIDQKS